MTHLGDDLEHAHIFVTSALSDMDLLLSDLRLDRERALKTVISVQSGAKSMKARGISRAATAVIQSYQDHHQQPKIDGRLMALYKLVVQYNDGLNEITEQIQTPEFSAGTSAETLELDELDLEIIDHELAYDQAKATLSELLPLAQNESGVLERLINLDLSINTDLHRELEKEPQVSFESLMPEVTDAALRSARGQGKSVSISYAAENLLIENSQVEQVRGELDRIVERLVKGKIGTPQQRQNAGLSRSGHIDVSAKQGLKGLNISVICEDETIEFTPRNKGARTIFKAQGLQEVGT